MIRAGLLKRRCQTLNRYAERLETRESAFEKEESFRGSQKSRQLQETTRICQEKKVVVLQPAANGVRNARLIEHAQLRAMRPAVKLRVTECRISILVPQATKRQRLRD